MAYVALTNGLGADGDGGSRASTSRGASDAAPITATELQDRGLAVVREGKREDLPPHVRDFVDEVTGGPKR